ncbi:MAG: hybrid sensor histidine kinase/response regulator [Candidatus Hodarchaeota archaeon]
MARLLIVDDEEHIRMLYQIELEDEGYDVWTAADGEMLLEKIEKKKLDLVVLDIKLSGYDGLYLLRDIHNRFPFIPVILCSAYDSFRYDIKASTADFYVVKSSDLTELKFKICQALENKIDIELITKSTAHEQIENILRRIINLQPPNIPSPDKMPSYLSVINDLDKRGFFDFFSREQLDSLIKDHCSEYYDECKRTHENAESWLLSNNIMITSRDLLSFYEDICPQGILWFVRFEEKIERKRSKLISDFGDLRKMLSTTKEKLEEGSLDPYFALELNKMFFKHYADPDQLMRYIQRTLTNIDNKIYSKVPLYDLLKVFRSGLSKNVESFKAISLGNVVIRDIRHDLKNKLTKMLIYMEDLKAEREPSIQEPLQKIFEAHEELSSIYARLKDIDFLSVVPSFEFVEVKQIIHEIVREFGLECANSVTVDYKGRPQYILTDRKLLGVSLRQVFQNAIEAIDPDGHIKLSIKPNKRQRKVRFIVEDNGCGIPKDVVSEVLKPNIGYGKNGHSGMGLALAKTALEALNGSIKLDSDLGAGTRVEISVPWEG